jgi:hypothetical protein
MANNPLIPLQLVDVSASGRLVLPSAAPAAGGDRGECPRKAPVRAGAATPTADQRRAQALPQCSDVTGAATCSAWGRSQFITYGSYVPSDVPSARCAQGAPRPGHAR